MKIREATVRSMYKMIKFDKNYRIDEKSAVDFPDRNVGNLFEVRYGDKSNPKSYLVNFVVLHNSKDNQKRFYKIIGSKKIKT